eukprot:3652670-Alexandrium_andersonii.AAC.1
MARSGKFQKIWLCLATRTCLKGEGLAKDPKQTATSNEASRSALFNSELKRKTPSQSRMPSPHPARPKDSQDDSRHAACTATTTQVLGFLGRRLSPK